MIDIEEVALQVKENCNISDAGYWGLYSPCGLLLRVRDLFKSENRMKPWESVNRAAIGDWIERRERLWNELFEEDFRKIEIPGKRFRPFDVRRINSVLLPEGFFYGAGYGGLMKPTFFLAELIEKRSRGSYSIYVTGRELAHDLSTSPSMLQGKSIIIRKEIMKKLLWEKYDEMVSRRHDSLLSRAFSEYGISRQSTSGLSFSEIDDLISGVTEEELSSYIYHELGEASQRRLLGKWWNDLISKLPYSRAELFVRALRDLLSDTCNSGMLRHIIAERKTGSLAFHIALLGGMRRVIFPEITAAYDEFGKSGNWTVIEKARVLGYRKTRSYMDELKRIATGGRVTPQAIEEEIIRKIM
jgi:hypothetical protein